MYRFFLVQVLLEVVVEVQEWGNEYVMDLYTTTMNPISSNIMLPRPSLVHSLLIVLTSPQTLPHIFVQVTKEEALEGAICLHWKVLKRDRMQAISDVFFNHRPIASIS